MRMNGLTRKTRTALLVAAMVSGFASLSAAQEAPANNLSSVHEKLKAEKKAIVAKYMGLTDAEAKNFWPVYDEYQNCLLYTSDAADE